MNLDHPAHLFYTSLPSAFGSFAIVWGNVPEGPRVRRIFLPGGCSPAQDQARAASAGVKHLSCPAMDELGEQIQRSLAGEPVDLPLGVIALEHCSPFQSRVLLAERGIPRGRVSTYGRIAGHLGVPGGARAVGRALSHNPFPIIIPCHRAIRASGDLGGFQGGLRMKRALLEHEGIAFSPSGKVLARDFYY